MRIAPKMIESGQGISHVEHGRTLHGDLKGPAEPRIRGMEVLLLYNIFSYKAKNPAPPVTIVCF